MLDKSVLKQLSLFTVAACAFLFVLGAQAQVTDDDVTPADDDATPADDDATPADDDATPADDDATPADDDVTPADDDATPADDDMTPADDDMTPADDDATPADDDVTPDDDDITVVDDDTTLVDDDEVVLPCEDVAICLEDCTEGDNECIQNCWAKSTPDCDTCLEDIRGCAEEYECIEETGETDSTCMELNCKFFLETCFGEMDVPMDDDSAGDDDIIGDDDITVVDDDGEPYVPDIPANGVGLPCYTSHDCLGDLICLDGYCGRKEGDQPPGRLWEGNVVEESLGGTGQKIGADTVAPSAPTTVQGERPYLPEDVEGCSCSTTGTGSAGAILILVGLLMVLRRRN